jgi:hypothetical protein
MVAGHQISSQQAENVMKAKPDDLPHRLVSHFQQLFEVRSVSGVLPRMTELYLYVNETNNFVKVLRNLLGLGKLLSSFPTCFLSLCYLSGIYALACTLGTFPNVSMQSESCTPHPPPLLPPPATAFSSSLFKPASPPLQLLSPPCNSSHGANCGHPRSA